jgi:hypothetical protein
MKPGFPDFSKGTPADIRRLAALRHLSPEAVTLALARGLLWFAALKGCAAWLVTDRARLNAQDRRMDGKLWEYIRAKAYTLPGSWAAWPVGIMEAQPFPAIAFCEGGPDLLAACHFIVCEAREPPGVFGELRSLTGTGRMAALFAGSLLAGTGQDGCRVKRTAGWHCG